MALDSKGDFVLEYANEADSEELARLFAAAFHDQPFFQKMQPDTDAARKAWTECTRYALRDPYTIALKVTDSKTGKIVSHGRWVKPRKDGDDCQPGHEEERWGYGFMESCDESLAGPMFAAYEKHREEMMGDRKHYYMELLETIEAYKGRGAGTLIVKHGCRLADRDGLECYIDASPAGRPLYEKFGWVFTKQERLPMDYHYNFGIRQPKKPE